MENHKCDRIQPRQKSGPLYTQHLPCHTYCAFLTPQAVTTRAKINTLQVCTELLNFLERQTLIPVVPAYPLPSILSSSVSRISSKHNTKPLSAAVARPGSNNALNGHLSFATYASTISTWIRSCHLLNDWTVFCTTTCSRSYHPRYCCVRGVLRSCQRTCTKTDSHNNQPQSETDLQKKAVRFLIRRNSRCKARSSWTSFCSVGSLLFPPSLFPTL